MHPYVSTIPKSLVLQQMHLLDSEKSIRQHIYFWAPPKAWNLSGCFFNFQVNASICVDHTKSPCVAKQRVATVRCACCVLELLRSSTINTKNVYTGIYLIFQDINEYIYIFTHYIYTYIIYICVFSLHDIFDT